MRRFFRLLVLSLAMFVPTVLMAQEWFPVGATWTYSVIYPSAGGDPWSAGEHPSVITCDRDTLINGVNAKVIKGLTFCSEAERAENIFYHNQDEDVVYIQINGEFKPYVDFSKKEGETYDMYYFSCMSESKYEHITFKIDSIRVENIGGINRRCQYLSKVSDNRVLMGNKMIEGIGSNWGFYPESGACDHEVSGGNGLRCYVDDNTDYHPIPLFEENGCDYIYKRVGIDETISSLDFNVYPNPAKDYITVEYNAKGLGKDLTLMISDVDGKTVRNDKLVNNVDSKNIDIKGLRTGNYVLSICSEGKVVYSKVFVVK